MDDKYCHTITKMYRRKYIQISVPAAVLVSGCIERTDPPIGFGELYVVNHREQEVDVQIKIKKESEEVYDNIHGFGGNESNAAETVRIIDDAMGERSYYEVEITDLSENIDRSYSTEEAEEFVDDWGENECFGLIVTIEPDDIYIGIQSMSSCPGR